MTPGFGTSGLRGLAGELTDTLVGDHVRAFAGACPMGGGLFIGRDLRESSPRIAAAVARAAQAAGLAVTDCGTVPTPALALAALAARQAAVMVTGSHIPAERNGLKFFTPEGEITKADEAAILAQLGRSRADVAALAGRAVATVGAPYVERYLRAWGDALSGLRVGVFAHSAVGGDLLAEVLVGLGAEVRIFGRSDRFVALDTEAVPPEIEARLGAAAAGGRLDAIVSTDGDGDRPLVADAGGRIVPGDVLGQISATELGAETVVTPVSAGSGAERSGRFGRVLRTRIGSPFVLEAMRAAGGRVIGYEANGGVILGYDARGPAGTLPRLMTRDAVLPLVAMLAASRRAGGVAARVAQEPPRFTASGRLENIARGPAGALRHRLEADPSPLLGRLGAREAGRDLTDGLRFVLADGRVLHLRPSGNAPEFRVYAEADSRAGADSLRDAGLALVRELLS